MEVPEGWSKSSLEKITTLITSGSRDWAKYYSEAGSLFIRMTNLPKDGIKIDFSDLKYVNLDKENNDGRRTRLQANDILVSITAELGRIGFLIQESEAAYINQHIALIRVDKRFAHPKFIAFSLASYPNRVRLNRRNDAGAKAALNLPSLRNFVLTIPSYPEQIKIAEILSTWDKAIATTEKLIENSKAQKKALMQQLLTGTYNGLRLSSFESKIFT